MPLPPVFGTASSGAPPIPHPLPRLVGTRRGGKMAQAKILHRTRAQWPGRNEVRNRILRAGTFAEGCRGISRKWGSGGGATMGGDAHRSPPPAAVCLLCRRGKGGRPAGRNPSHGTKPFRKTAGGSETRPYNISGRSPQNGTTGGASPSPTGKRKTSRRGGTGAQCAPLRRFQGLHRSQRDEAHPSSSRPRARPVWSPSRNPWTA